MGTLWQRARALLALVLAFMVSFTMPACAPFGRYIATLQYGQVDEPFDREAAISATSSVPSADIRAVIGGKGEGVDCSIPRVLETLAFPPKGGVESPISLQFRQACVFHDYCYRHGYATYGFSQVDCDFLLLQQAFRTCIQIYEFGDVETRHTFAGTETTNLCRARAREVLLGVRLGGAGSFKAHGESSYFEFDPMPMLAQGYVIGRLTNVGLDTRPLKIDDVALLSTPTTFQIERGRVYVRQLRWNADEENAERHELGAGDVVSTIVFPGDSVPTPPSAVRLGGTDRYVWLTRKAPYNTEFDVLLLERPSSGASGSFTRLPCPKVPASELRPTPWQKCDFDSSILRVLPSADDQAETLRFLAFSHRFADKTLGKDLPPEPATIGLHQWSFSVKDVDDPATASPPVPAPAKIGHASSHKNRFLQSELLVGEFRKEGCQDAVAFGRGVHVIAQSNADHRDTVVGKNYRATIAAAFIPLDGDRCPPPDWRQVALPEATEPAAPVRRSGQTDGLLTIDALSNPERVRITEYGFARDDTAKRVMTFHEKGGPLDASWVKTAVYVVKPPSRAPRNGNRGDRLFFSRVTVDRNRIAPDGAPNVVEIAFRYFESSEVGWTESGYTSCQIDLKKQHELEPAQHQLGATRPLMHGKMGLIRRRARETPVPPGEKWSDFWTSLYRKLDRQEMARQWAQSQVIPGYIFDAEATAADRPIDAVVIFGGSADYSLLLQGVRGGSDGLNRLEIRRPSGALQFVDCG